VRWGNERTEEVKRVTERSRTVLPLSSGLTGWGFLSALGTSGLGAEKQKNMIHSVIGWFKTRHTKRWNTHTHTHHTHTHSVHLYLSHTVLWLDVCLHSPCCLQTHNQTFRERRTPHCGGEVVNANAPASTSCADRKAMMQAWILQTADLGGNKKRRAALRRGNVF